jgi:hypothetical protein
MDDDDEISDLNTPVSINKGAENLAHSDMSKDPTMRKFGSDKANEPESWNKQLLPYDTKFQFAEEKVDEPKIGDDNVTDTEFMNKERQGLQDGEENNVPEDTTNDINPETEMGTENDVEAGDGENQISHQPMNNEPESDEINQIAQDKEEVGEMIAGGKGEGKSVNEFDPEQILMGMRVEMEHSDDPMVALEICIDHLSENPEYYTVDDENPDDSAQANASADANGGEGDDKDMEDILLGFKPHNVGDEVPDISRKPRMAEPEETSEEEPKVEPKKKEDELGESENKKINNLITEEQIKMAKLTLNNRNIPTRMSKKEAVQILMNNNLKKIL